MMELWIRWQACRMAAQCLQGDLMNGDVCQRLWSATVFFELYMRHGGDGTKDDFGPKDAVQLQTVKEEGR
jgi:hypothetical protein